MKFRILLIAILLLVLTSAASAQVTPPVLDEYSQYVIDTGPTGIVTTVVRISNVSPGTVLRRHITGIQKGCGPNDVFYAVDESVSAGPVNSAGRVVDTFDRWGCVARLTVTYIAANGEELRLPLYFNLHVDAPLPSPVPLGYQVGATAELTQVQTLFFFPRNHGYYNGQARDIYPGTEVLIINGPVYDFAGVGWYQVRTLAGTASQQGWVRDYALQVVTPSPYPNVNPAAELSLYHPQGKVPEGSFNINVRPLPTVRKVDGAYVAPTFTQLEGGEVVNVIGQSNNRLWLQVQKLDTLETGWVCAHFLMVNFDHPYLANNHSQGWYFIPPLDFELVSPPEDCTGRVVH